MSPYVTIRIQQTGGRGPHDQVFKPPILLFTDRGQYCDDRDYDWQNKSGYKWLLAILMTKAISGTSMLGTSIVQRDGIYNTWIYLHNTFHCWVQWVHIPSLFTQQ